MYHKVLVFINESGEKKRVYIRDGVCRNKAVMDLVSANGSGFMCETVKVKGNPLDKPHLKYVDNRGKAPIQVPVEFLGIQSAAKAPAPVQVDAEGKAVKPKRGKKSKVTPELIEGMKKEAEAGHTLKEAEKALGVSYATLHQTAKKHGIVFTKGKKGKTGKREAKPVDTEFLSKVQALANEGKTTKEAASALEVSYATIHKFSKDNGIVFAKGIFGKRKGSGKSVDLEAVKVEHAKGSTTKEAADALGVTYALIVKAAKLLDLKFKAGKRGREKGWKKAA